MRNIYRDRPVPEPDEALPDLAVPPLRWGDVLRRLCAYLVCAAGLAVFSDTTQAAVFLGMVLPGLVVVAGIVALQAPVRAWLACRHARVVADGVARLEAMVAQSDAHTDAPAQADRKRLSDRITTRPTRIESDRAVRCPELPTSGRCRVTLLFDAACAVRVDDDDREASPREQIAKHRRHLVGDRARE
ncbi:MAG: hypothetical protein JWP87_5363 [Labilithrix sp.]|nr:hypothetical protein [Labilithrix sp.]